MPEGANSLIDPDPSILSFAASCRRFLASVLPYKSLTHLKDSNKPRTFKALVTIHDHFHVLVLVPETRDALSLKQWSESVSPSSYIALYREEVGSGLSRPVSTQAQ